MCAYLGALTRLYTVGDVEVHELRGQVHSCGQAVHDLHAVQAEVHVHQHPQILTHLAAVHQPQQGLHCNRTGVGPFASMPEVLLPITQATAAVTRVNLYER